MEEIDEGADLIESLRDFEGVEGEIQFAPEDPGTQFGVSVMEIEGNESGGVKENASDVITEALHHVLLSFSWFSFLLEMFPQVLGGNEESYFEGGVGEKSSEKRLKNVADREKIASIDGEFGDVFKIEGEIQEKENEESLAQVLCKGIQRHSPFVACFFHL